jgi:hypothetical protein
MPVAKQRTAVTASIAAPIGGWNARDSVAEMNPLDAVELINWYPTPSDLTLRKGYSKFSTGMTGQVNTVMNYASPTTQKMFAAVGSKIFDTTTSTAVEVLAGQTNDKWQTVNISTAGGNFLVACNGADPVTIYNGTYWFSVATTATGATISTITRGGTGNLTATVTTATAHGLVTNNQVTVSGAVSSEYNGTYRITVTGTNTFTYVMATAPAANAVTVGTYLPTGITGVDSSTFINVNLYKNRLWFTQEDTLKVWYLPVNSIAGASAEINFGGIARNGGFLQAMGTWTIDAGEGVDDYAAFVTSMGEVIIYTGTDPTSPTTWALKGVWQMGQTFSRRCFYKFAGDLLLLTKDGLVPMAGALQSSRLDPRVNLTDKIFYAISQAADLYATNFGWEISYYAQQNMLIINVPTNYGSQQFVMHTITKAWAQFTDIDANCFVIHNDELYFGGNGFVGKFWDTSADDETNITASAQQAYSYFDSRGQQKRFTMVRPILQVDNGTPTIVCGINVDFETTDATGSVTFNPAALSSGIWDTSLWDDAIWSGGLVINKVWQGVNGIGYSAGMYMKIAAQDINVRWASTDYVMEKGGVL